jgi:hypothetical protein
MKILNYKLINKGTVIAAMDIEIPEWGFTIKRCTEFNKEGKRWISFPSYKFNDEQGGTKYSPYVFMEKTRKERFDKGVLALLDAGTYEPAAQAEKPMPREMSVTEECPF